MRFSYELALERIKCNKNKILSHNSKVLLVYQLKHSLLKEKPIRFKIPLNLTFIPTVMLEITERGSRPLSRNTQTHLELAEISNRTPGR